MPRWPLQTTLSPRPSLTTLNGHYDYYRKEKGRAHDESVLYSPLLGSGGDKWQGELDGRRRLSVQDSWPLKDSDWRNKKLPTPEEEENGHDLRHL